MKKDQQNVSISDTEKKELLDQNSPSNDKGEFPIGTIQLSDEELKDDSPKLEQPFPKLNSIASDDDVDDTLKDKEPDSVTVLNKDSEPDFSLSPEEFNAKFIEKKKGNIAFNPSEFSGLNTIDFGQGVEDYRDYIKNPIKGKYLDYNRALNQSNSEQFGNATKRFIANIVPEIIKQAGNSVEGLANIISGRDSYGNPVSETMQEFQNWVNTENPIFAENPNKALDVGDFAWWADRGSSLATSIGAFIALGYATGGLNLGTKITQALGSTGRATGITNLLKSPLLNGADDLAKFASNSKGGFNIANITDTLATSFLLTTAESIGTSKEVYDTTYAETKQELIRKGLSEEEAEKQAREIASATADRAFNFNQMNIALNMTSLAPFIKRNKFANAGQIRKRTLKGGGTKLGLEAVQEASEESINFLSERFATDENYDISKAFKDLMTAEGLESALLGAIGGVGQTGLTLTGQYIPTSKDIKTGKRTSDYTRYKKRLAQQEDLKSKYESYSNTKSSDLLDIFSSVNQQLELHNEIYKARQNNDEKLARQLSEQLFVNQAYQAFSAGLGATFKSSIENLIGLTDEQAESLEYDISENNNYREVLKERLNTLNELENIYNKVSGLYKGDDAYSYASESYYYKDLLSKNNQILDSYLEQLNPIISKLTEESEGSFEFDKNLGEYKFNNTNLLKAELDSISEEKIKIEDNIEKLKINLAKDKDGLKSLKRNKDVDSSNQINVTEDRIKRAKELILEEENKLKKLDLKLGEVNDTIKQKVNKIDILTSELNNNPNLAAFQTLLKNNNDIQIKIEGSEKSFNEIVSEEGQKKAKKEIEEGKKLYEEEIVKNKVKEKQNKQEVKKKRETKEKEVEENLEEEIQQSQKNITDNVEEPNDLRELLNENDVTVEEFQQELNITDETILNKLVQINNKTSDQQFKQRLIKGLIKDIYSETESDENVDGLLTLYNELVNINGDDIKYSLNQLLNSQDTSVQTLTDFLDKNTSKNIANEIDSISYNLEDKTSNEFLDSIKNAEEKTINQFNSLISSLLKNNGLNYNDSFNKIINVLNDELGTELTKRIFYKLQGFISFKTGKRLNKYYSTIVKNKEERLKDQEEQKRLNKSTRQEEFLQPSLKEINDSNKQAVKANIVIKEGKVLEEVNFEGDENTFTSAKSTTVSKLAFKSISSERFLSKENLVDTRSTGIINTELDKRLLKNTIKIGDVLTFEVIPEFIDNFGNKYTTIEEDGNTFTYIKSINNPIAKKYLGVEKAPIAVKLNGEILEDAYLHLPEFINDENLAESSNFELEFENLNVLRSSVLRGDDVYAEIDAKGEGHFIQDNKLTLTSTNLPNVEIGLAINGAIETTNGRPFNIEINTDYLISGIPVAMIPKGDGVVPINLHKNKLNENQVNLIAEIIKLKFYKESDFNAQDYINIDILKKEGINIRENSSTSIESLRNLLRDYIELKSISDDFNFETELNKYDYSVVFFNKDKDKLILKAGNKNITISEFEINNDFRNNKEDIDAAIESLKLILADATINFNRNNIQKTNFSPFTKIEGGTISKTDYSSYADFIKENTRTNFKSENIDGEDIYSVQHSIFFTPVYNTNVSDIESSEFDDLNDDYQFSLESESLEIDSKELSEETKTFLRTNTELAEQIIEDFAEDSFIKNLPVIFQEKFVNSLVSMVVSEASIPTIIGLNSNDNITMSSIENKFASKLNAYKKLIPSKIEKLNKILDLLIKANGDYTALAFLQDNPLYIILSKSESPIKTLEDMVANHNYYLDVIETALNNIDKLSSFAVYRLKSYTLLNSTRIDNEEEQPDGGNIRTNYDSDYYFSLNGKDQLTANIKNLLIGIKDADYIGQKDNGEEVIINKTFLGLDVVVPFDKLYTEIQSIISQASYNFDSGLYESTDKFNAILKELSYHYNSKPYLVNLVNRLKTLDIQNRNAFITNMSKSKVNHINTFTSFYNTSDVELGTTEKLSLTNKPTNSINIASKLLKEWENSFYTSDIVTVDENDEVIIDKEKLLDFKEQALLIEKSIKQYKKDKFNKLLKDFKGTLTMGVRDRLKLQAFQPDDTIINGIKKQFENIGFDFSKDFLYDFYTRKYKTKNSNISITNFASNNTGFIGVILDNLIDKKGQVRNFNKSSNNIFNDSYLQSFARYASSFETSLFAASYTNGQGNNVYGFALNKFLTDRVKELKTNPKVVNDIISDPFQGTGLFLDQIFNKSTGEFKNNKIYNLFDYFTFDSNIVTKYGFNAKTLNKMSSAGYEQVALNLFYNKGIAPNNNLLSFNFDGKKKNVTYRFGKLLAPTFSDKKTAMGLNSIIYNVDLDSDSNLNADNVIYDILLNEVVLPEYNRIRASQNNSNVNIENYNEASKLFYFIPSLNYNSIIREEDGSLKDIETDPFAKAAIKEEIILHIEFLKENKLQEWRENNIINSRGNLKFVDNSFIKKGNNINPNRLAYEFVANYLISNANYFKLFAGDPALYYKKGNNTDQIIRNTFDNIGKRLAAQIAPGTDVISKENEFTKIAVLQDAKNVKGLSNSTNITYLESLLGKQGAALYRNGVAGTDAMGYSTVKEWSTIEFKRGNISEKDYKRINILDNKSSLNESDLDFINKTFKKYLLNSNKPVFSTNYKDGNIMRTIYIKPSVLPLLSNLTKGLELDKLRKAMLRDNVDTVFYKTAVKVGSPSENLNIFNNNGTIKDNISFKDEKGNNLKHTLDIPRKAHKIQLDNPINKIGVTDGSQQRKLLFADILNVNTFKHPITNNNVTGDALRTEFNQLYVQLFKNKYNTLVDELNYDYETGQYDLRELQKVLKNEFEERGFSLSNLSYLNIKEDGKGGYEFAMPLWTSTISSKIESLLISIIDNKIRRIEAPGNSFILASNAGFKPVIKEGQDVTDFIKNNSDIVFDKKWIERGDFELKGQREEDGKILPAEIMIASKFRDSNGKIIEAKNLISNEGYIDTEKVPEELLKYFGYRIPTQGLNSMSYMKIVGFLPQQYSEMILAPSDFTVQMGSDFDIDKLYTNSYVYTEDKGKLSKVISPDINKEELSGDQILNRILDIKFAVLSNKDIQAKIHRPLDKNIFEEYAKDIEEQYNEDKSFSPISQSQFKSKYLNGVNGASAIGIFANASTLHAILQNKDKDLYNLVKEGKIQKIRIGSYTNSSRKSNALSDTQILGRNDNMSKSDVISNLLTTAVDNENLQVLSKLNFNNETYNFIIGTTMLGFDPEFITYFVNQPIIRDYVKLGTKVNDSSIAYNNTRRFIEMQENYGGYIEYKPEDGYAKFIDFDWEVINKDPDSAFNFSLVDLKNNITNRKSKSELKETTNDFYNKQQTAILYKFITLQKTLENIQKLQETVNIDGSNGIGSSMLYSLRKEQQIRDILYLPITNAINLLGDVAVVPKQEESDYVDGLNEQDYFYFEEFNDDIYYVKPTTILGGMYEYALKPVNDLYNRKDLFPFTDNILSSLTEYTFELLKGNRQFDTIKQEINFRKKSLNYVKQFLFSDLFNNLFYENIKSERTRLFSDTDNNKSLATILKQVRRDYPNLFKNNMLLNSLDLFKGNNTELSKINFNALEETTSLDFLANSIYDLLQDNKEYYNQDGIVYRGKDIALDLIRHQYLSGGVQFRKQFIKYIPFEVFEAFGINDNIRNFDLNNLNPDTHSKYVNRYIVQFAQHFPESIETVLPTANVDLENKVFSSKKLTNPNLDKIVKIYFEGEELLGYRIAENATEFQYSIIDKAGDLDNNVLEFDSTVDYIESIIPYNNKAFKLEDYRQNYNKTQLNSLLKKNLFFRYRANPKGNWTRIFSDDYSKLDLYNKTYGSDNVELISKKESDGRIKIYNKSIFRGSIALDSKVFNTELLEEGKDFDTNIDLQQTINKEKQNLTDIQRFKKRLGITNNTEESLNNLINNLKEVNKDSFREYTYDLLLDSIPNLLLNNPNLKINITKSGATGSVVKRGGKIVAINFNVKGLDSIDITKDNEFKNIHRTVIEELLHSITLTEANSNSQYRKDLNDIRTKLINNLNEDEKANYNELLSNLNSLKYLDAVLINKVVNKSDFIKRLNASKNREDFNKLIFNTLRSAVENSTEDQIDLNNVYNILFKDNVPKSSLYKKYYPLTDLDEFIAGVFLNKQLQDSLNKINYDKKDSLLERFIKLIIRAVNSLSSYRVNIGEQAKWQSMFSSGINKDSLLEDAIAKSIILIKNYNKNKLNKQEKKILKAELEKSSMSVEDINGVFNLKFENEYKFIENAAELAGIIRSSFKNVDVKTHKKNYIIVQDKNRTNDIDLNKEFFERQNTTDFNNSENLTLFNLEGGTNEEKNENRKNRLLALRNTRIKKLKDIANIAKASGDNKRYRFITNLLEELASEENLDKIANLDSLADLAKIAERDLEEVETILNNDTLAFSDAMYIKRILSNWNNVFENYFTEEEQNYAKFAVEEFSNILNKSTNLTKNLSKKLIKLYEENIEREFGDKINLEEHFKNFEDVDLFNREGADISRVGNKLLDFVHQKVQRAFNQTKRETFDVVENIESILKDAMPTLKTYATRENGEFDIMLQKYEDGTLTGDLVSPFKKEFIDDIKDQFSTLNQDDKEKRLKAGERLNKWLKKNTIYFNPLLLYRETSNKEEKEAHIKELKSLLGTKLFDYYYEKQRQLDILYNNDKQEKLDDLLLLNNAKDKEELKQLYPSAYNEYVLWQAENSPYIHYAQVNDNFIKEVELIEEDGSTIKKKVYNRGYEYLVNVPKDINNFDSSFKTILDNKDLLKFYDAYTAAFEELKKYLPPSAQEAIRFNGLPELEKTFYENITQSGYASSFNDIYSNFKKSLRVDDLSDTKYTDVDKTTGEENRFLDFNLFNNNRREYTEYLNRRLAEYDIENDGFAPDADFYKQVQKDYNNIVAKRKSKDLGKILKAYTGLSLTYKHKSRIQDAVTAAELVINEMPESERNPDGKFMKDIFGDMAFKPKSVAYFSLKQMFSHYLDNFFDRPYKLQGVSDKRILTKEELKSKDTYKDVINKRQEELEQLEIKFTNGKIKKEEYEARKEYLNNSIEESKLAIENLGGNIVYSKIGDKALKLFQLKGMGWNLLAGIGNLGYGVTSNLIESNDNRLITKKEMLDAIKLSFNSIGRNATFNKWSGKDDVALKIRSLMDRNDVLKEASHELYANTVKGSLGSKLRFLSPYNLQKRTEYLNQSPIMIAFYKKTKVKTDKGEISLWEGYDNNGKWKEEYGEEPNQIINKTNAKITQYIKRVHGNYDPSSPMKLKQGIGGRALIQFRSWLVESIKQRWQPEVYDSILEVEFKGRYRSAGTYAKQFGYGGFLLDTLKSVLLNIVGQKVDFTREGLNEVDAVNMRKLVSEITVYLAMYGAYLGLSFMFRDDEIPEKEQEALNVTLNMINRVKNELTIYINPIEAYKIAKNPAPAMGLVGDVANILKASKDTIMGEPVIENGIYAGDNKLWKSIKSFVPFVTSVKAIETNMKQEFK